MNRKEAQSIGVATERGGWMPGMFRTQSQFEYKKRANRDFKDEQRKTIWRDQSYLHEYFVFIFSGSFEIYIYLIDCSCLEKLGNRDFLGRL